MRGASNSTPEHTVDDAESIARASSGAGPNDPRPDASFGPDAGPNNDPRPDAGPKATADAGPQATADAGPNDPSSDARASAGADAGPDNFKPDARSHHLAQN